MQATDIDLASPSSAACEATPCGEFAARALCTRVAALRAALEGLEASLPLHDRSIAIVLCARRELEILARDVRAVVDWSMPSPLRPSACSFEEIGLGAVDALPREDRGRTLVAVEHPGSRLVADVTVLTRALSRLVEHGFTLGAEHAALQVGPGPAGFMVTLSFDGAGDPRTTLSSGLADALARRDLSRLGAHVDSDEGARRLVVSLACAEASR